jgi:hypothetical protein
VHAQSSRVAALCDTVAVCFRSTNQPMNDDGAPNDNNVAAAAAAAAAAVLLDEEEEGAANDGGFLLLLNAIRRKQSSLATIQTGHPERESGGGRSRNNATPTTGGTPCTVCRAIRPVEGGAAPYRFTARGAEGENGLWLFAAARRSSQGVRSGGRLPSSRGPIRRGCSRAKLTAKEGFTPVAFGG